MPARFFARIRGSSQADALLFAGATVRAARCERASAGVSRRRALARVGLRSASLIVGGRHRHRAVHAGDRAAAGVDPYDPFASIDGAAALLGEYVAAYRDRYADAYAAALAAYNAGPLAVAQYRGVPPYAETREYVALIFDRWARIVSYERTGGPSL